MAYSARNLRSRASSGASFPSVPNPASDLTTPTSDNDRNEADGQSETQTLKQKKKNKKKKKKKKKKKATDSQDDQQQQIENTQTTIDPAMSNEEHIDQPLEQEAQAAATDKGDEIEEGGGDESQPVVAESSKSASIPATNEGNKLDKGKGVETGEQSDSSRLEEIYEKLLGGITWLGNEDQQFLSRMIDAKLQPKGFFQALELAILVDTNRNPKLSQKLTDWMLEHDQFFLAEYLLEEKLNDFEPDWAGGEMMGLDEVDELMDCQMALDDLKLKGKDKDGEM